MKLIKAFFMCMGMFTAIPLPYRPWDEDAREWMTACLPAVGLVVGLLWWGAALLGKLILPAGLLAAWIAAVPFLLTGFMHLDGFMDTADALLSWRPLEERQKILKDVHCGSFSVVAIVLLMMGMYASAACCTDKDLRVLIFIPAVSRCMSAFCVTVLPAIGHSQYSGKAHSSLTPIVCVCEISLLILLTLLICGPKAILVPLGAVIGYVLSMLFAFRTMKGVSGDLAGYALSVGELCALAVLACL